MALLPRRLSPSRAAIPGRWLTQREAERALAAYISNIDRGLAAAPGARGGPTRKVRDLVQEYITARTNDPVSPLAARTVRTYTAALHNYICYERADLGRVVVSRLDAPTINKWLGDLITAGFGRPTVQYARRLVSSALSWEVEQGGLHVNPAAAIRIRTTKASRAAQQVADPVLVPTWDELTKLVLSPTLISDRLLIAVMAWCGLRWSEAISLTTESLNPKENTIAVTRVLTYTKETDWVVEAVKAGLVEKVSVPKHLMAALVKLAATRTEPASKMAGNLLFRSAEVHQGGIGAIDASGWQRRVWKPARVAAGLNGDPTVPDMDPRRRAIKIKDLRATTASVLVDAGATRLDAASHLRHADPRTTDKYYSRALADSHHTEARAAIRQDTTLNLSGRLSALFDAWVDTAPKALKNGLLMENGAIFGATQTVPAKPSSKKP